FSNTMRRIQSKERLEAQLAARTPPQITPSSQRDRKRSSSQGATVARSLSADLQFKRSYSSEPGKRLSGFDLPAPPGYVSRQTSLFSPTKSSLSRVRSPESRSPAPTGLSRSASFSR